MDTKEKHIRENEPKKEEARDGANNYVGGSLLKNAHENRNNNTRKTNRLWLWLGVLILIFILVWWLFSIGTFEDILGTSNG